MPDDFTPIPNTLGDLTNRENRAFRPRFSNDYTGPNGVPDGIPDDLDGNGIPDLYPSLYPQVPFATRIYTPPTTPTAADLGYSEFFIPRTQGPITDDHVPLLDAGLRVIDVIDIDYDPHHTPDDTLDKVSAKSLQVVGDVALSLVR